MAQRNRKRSRGGANGARGETGNGANGSEHGAEHQFPELESGEDALTEAQMAVGRPDPAERPDDQELTDFEEEDAGRGPSAGALSTAATRRSRRESAPMEEAPSTRRPGIFGQLVGFVQGSWRELQRVQWPDRPQVFQATGVVLGFVIVAGAFLALSSFVAQKIVNLILYGHG